MLNTPITLVPDTAFVVEGAARAAAQIPPLFPLAANVAVNPFLGQSGEPLAQASARLQRVAGLRATMPRDWYAARIAAGEVTEGDLVAALDAAGSGLTLDALRTAGERPAPAALPTVADLVAAATGVDWPGLVVERFGHWAAGYFDEGQALWTAGQGRAYDAWRTTAMHDLTPEIAGLTGFARQVASLPQSPEAAMADSALALGIGPDAAESVFHRLLTDLGGWAQLAACRSFNAGLAGASDTTLTDLLAIRLVWEVALLREGGAEVAARWQAVLRQHAQEVRASGDDVVDAILQEAVERAAQRRLSGLVGPSATLAARPVLQMAFCIDVRSEVFRRALESLNSGIETLGFAGFFGLGIAHRCFASDVAEMHLPVLLNPGLQTRSGDGAQDGDARLSARARRAWGRFKASAVSSFAFVEAAGPSYAAKLLRDGLGLGKGEAPDTAAPQMVPTPDLPTRVATAEAVLRAMSLTGGFARLVILAGHGANVTNNPHASALHCGACGGYSGEVNARLLAGLLNDPEVRRGLAEKGIAVAADTHFLAALHDTTTDAVTLFTADAPSPAHARDIGRAQDWLAQAGLLARGERALRLPRATAANVPGRAKDWAETRPEWGLAGCQAFIAAPRSRTLGRDLGGRAFLHTYDWRQDAGFGTLELILTAPVVVASWISLQYYGSAVAPGLFGGGNKLLHNVVGGVGVVEGNGGVLRGGLPWQSVHDGARLVHDPLRLSVLVEAPTEAISAVLAKHAGVRALFDNRWLHLFALDDTGRMAWRYRGGLAWEEAAAPAAERQPEPA